MPNIAPKFNLLIRQLITFQIIVLIISLCMSMISGHYFKPRQAQTALEEQATLLTLQLMQLQTFDQASITQLIKSQNFSPNVNLFEIKLPEQHWFFSKTGQILSSTLAKKTNSGEANKVSIEHAILTTEYNHLQVLPQLILNATIEKHWNMNVFIIAFFCLLAISVYCLLLINYRLKKETQSINALLEKKSANASINSNAQTITSLNLLASLHQPLIAAIEHDALNLEKESLQQSAKYNDPNNQQYHISVLNQELALARESAINANRHKNRIIANVSHELLTPLNSIVGFSDLLLQHDIDSKKSNEYLQLIYENSIYLTSLVNELTLFSDNGSRDFTLNYSKTQVYDLLKSIGQTHAVDASKKQLRFNFELNISKSLLIDIDTVRFRQIISNLLVNAIRHTQQGSVTLSADLLSYDDEQQSLAVQVIDTGCGITPSQQEVIFDAFVSETFQDTKQQERTLGLGLGLGLAIVQSLVTRLGATVELSSEKNKGSTFTVKFPIRNSLQKSKTFHSVNVKTLTPNDLQQSPKTLIVDDNKSNSTLLKSLVKALFVEASCHIDVADSGETALLLLKENQYDWVFLDIRMQPMDGIELLQKLRKETFNKKTIAIACTAHTTEHEFRQFAEVGFDEIIHKPISSQLLIELYQKMQHRLFEHPIHTVLSDQKHTPAVLNNDFDPQLAIDRAGGNAATAKEIFILFVNALGECLNEKKLAGKNRLVLIESIHQLNGAAAISAVPKLKALFNNMEGLLKANDDINNTLIQAKLTTLKTSVQNFYIKYNNSALDDLFKVK